MSSVLLTMLIFALGMLSACDSGSDLQPQDPRLTGMPGVTKDEVAELIHHITGAPFEIEWIGSPGPIMVEPIENSDLGEICKILSNHDWQIVASQDSISEAIDRQPRLSEAFGYLTYVWTFNPMHPTYAYEYSVWYQEKMELLLDEPVDPNWTEDDFLDAILVERMRQMLIRMCSIVESS